MQISLKWISELIDIRFINLNDLINKLTLGGFEVEDTIEINIDGKNQTTLEISSTANRSDSLSIQGISAEIAMLCDQQINLSNFAINSLKWKEQITTNSNIQSNKSDCLAFTALTIENINTVEIPKWLLNKLINSNVIPTNTILDFQNYVLLETGYPIAIYDLEKIQSKLNMSTFELKVKRAEKNSVFQAINESNYNLDDSILIVKANDLSLSIAGIIENKDVAFSQATTSILIEGSIFNSAKIRQQSRNLGLRTDRSARYEKSLKSTYLTEALYRLVTLLRISNPNLKCKFHTSTQICKQELKSITLYYKTIKEILGPIENKIGIVENYQNYISKQLIHSYLKRLKFNFIFNNTNEYWKVEIPSLRSDDLTHEIDLIEEIGRLQGFDTFLTTLPKIKTIGNEDQSYQTRKKLTSCLLNLGLNELINYSLVNDKTFIINEVKLLNPLISDCSNLRSSLLPSLLLTSHENLKQGNLPIQGFEYGHVFSNKTQSTFKEIEKIAGIIGGNKIRQNWSEQLQSLSWFAAKGKLEKLFLQLNIKIDWEINSEQSMAEILHPYRSSTIVLKDGTSVGNFGQIHPLLAKKLMLLNETYLFELDLKQIQNQIYKTPLILYKAYPVYPKIIKDLSFIVKQNIAFNDIQNLIYYNGTKFLSDIKLIDDYKGKSISVDCVSLCVQLTFQAKNKTLKNTEIDQIIKNIEQVLKQEFNAILRK